MHDERGMRAHHVFPVILATALCAAGVSAAERTNEPAAADPGATATEKTTAAEQARAEDAAAAPHEKGAAHDKTAAPHGKGAAHEGAAHEKAAAGAKATAPTKGAQAAVEKAPPMEATAGQIAAEPSRFVGRAVRVKAEVETVHGSHVFTLDEDQIGAEPDVLVVAPAAVPASIEDTSVTVTGPVRTFVKVEFEREYEWFDADDFGDPDLVARFESRPVIVARSIRDADGREIATAAATKPQPAEGSAEPQAKAGEPRSKMQPEAGTEPAEPAREQAGSEPKAGY